MVEAGGFAGGVGDVVSPCGVRTGADAVQEPVTVLVMVTVLGMGGFWVLLLVVAGSISQILWRLGSRSGRAATGVAVEFHAFAVREPWCELLSVLVEFGREESATGFRNGADVTVAI